MRSRLSFLSWLVMVVATVVLVAPRQVRAENVYCFCYDEVGKITADNLQTIGGQLQSSGKSFCQDNTRVASCDVAAVKKAGGLKYDKCDKQDTQKSCEEAAVRWENSKGEKLLGFTPAGQKKGAIIPGCVDTEQGCRDAGIFIEMGINLAGYIFGIVGALALLMFVYGGFTLVLSGGNPEKVKKGGEIFMSAVIGLVIVFGAYMLVQFMGQTLGVQGDYLLK